MASVDARKVESHIFPDKYGVHKCATFGDHRGRLADIATLIGFELVEEDE